MMQNGASLADLAAVTNMGRDGYGNGSWVWLILIIFCVFGGYGNGWNNGWNGNIATSADVQRSTDAVTTNARFDSLFNNQARNAMDNMSLIDRNQSENANLIAQNRYDNATLIKDAQYNNLVNTNNLTNVVNTGFTNIGAQLNNGFAGVDKAICQSTFATTQALNDGFNSVNQNLCGISHQISDGVCAIKTQLLQDKYDQLKDQYNLSVMANTNAVQTQNILNTLGTWYAKPPYYPVYYGNTGTVVG